MSGNSAPPRRSLSTSLTLRSTSALLDFMLAHLLVDPCGVPVVQTGVVDHRQVLHVAVRSQVGRSLENQAQAIPESQTNHLGVAAGGADDLAALLHQFRDSGAVLLGAGLGHEIRTQQRQAADNANV